MNIGRKYLDSFMRTMGVLAIIFTVMSLIYPQSIQIKHLYLMIAISIPTNAFAFFTFELRLFSRHLWIRRFIVIGFGILSMLVVTFIFGYPRGDSKYFVLLGVLLICYAVLTIFIHYISDKIEKRNLELINQRLADESAKELR